MNTVWTSITSFQLEDNRRNLRTRPQYGRYHNCVTQQQLDNWKFIQEFGTIVQQKNYRVRDEQGF